MVRWKCQFDLRLLVLLNLPCRTKRMHQKFSSTIFFSDINILQVVMYYVYLGIGTAVASFFRKYTSRHGLYVSTRRAKMQSVNVRRF